MLRNSKQSEKHFVSLYSHMPKVQRRKSSKKMVKHCAWGTCKSDSRYLDRLINSERKSVKFHPFPSVKKEKVQREAWIRACCRRDNFVCTKHSYICGFHFVGNSGPTKEHPDPIPATASREKVRQYMFARVKICTYFIFRVTIFTYLTTLCCF